MISQVPAPRVHRSVITVASTFAWLTIASNAICDTTAGTTVGTTASTSAGPATRPVTSLVASSNPANLDAERRANIDRIMFHLNASEKDTGMIPAVYDPNAVFSDPIFPDGLQGTEALLRYHTALNAMTESFEVHVSDILAKEDTYVVLWEATATIALHLDLGSALRQAHLPTFGLPLVFTPYKLGPVHYAGVTTFEFAAGAARVSIHRDYYDGMAMFEKLPGLGQALGLIKSQMRKSLTGPLRP